MCIDVKEKFKKCIMEVVQDDNLNIEDETDLIVDVGMDSILLMMLIIKVEEEFEFCYPDDLLVMEILSKFKKLYELILKFYINKEER